MSGRKKQSRPEFLTRVDEAVVFKPLPPEQRRAIGELMVADLRDRLIAEGMSIELTDAARDLVAKQGADPVYGARPLRRAIQTLIEDPLSEELLQEIYQWKDERNRLIHALMKQNLHTEDLQKIALEGQQIVKQLNSKATNYRKALERQAAKAQKQEG